VTIGSSRGGILAVALAALDHRIDAVFAHNILDPTLPASIQITRFPRWLARTYPAVRMPRPTCGRTRSPADQADAYVLLFDHLGIGEVDVLGISAGTTSALQLALRHPDRVRHLVIVSGNLPGNPTAVTLLRRARDDPLCAFAATGRAAARIPGAVFVPLDRGGHLGLGQTERTRREISAFLGAPGRASA
jgi:alpha/beta hydrolase fold